MTESGEINLTKNSIYFLKRTDVEFLIKEGIVKHEV
jgi:hypothetical protein